MPSTRSSPAIQQVPISPRERFASVCAALWSSLKNPVVICLAALLASHRFAALHLGPCPDVYLEDGRIQIDNNLVENFILRTALGKRTGCSQAMPMPANAAPSLNCHSRLPHLRSKFQNYGGWRDAYPVSARSTLRLPTTFLYSSLAKRFRRRCTERTTGGGSQGRAQASTRASSSRSTS